ncbi:MAG: hypothetical protein WAX89_05360 [Alphaproteobacteria bacterium]
MMSLTEALVGLYIYPIKGFGIHAAGLPQVQVQPSIGFIGDRAFGFAIKEVPAGEHRPKDYFLTGMRYPQLLSYIARSNSGSDLHITFPEGWEASFWEPDNPAAVALCQKLKQELGIAEDVRLVSSENALTYTDSAQPNITLGNAGTVRAFGAFLQARGVKATVTPNRFRWNMLVNVPAFEELTWIGQDVEIGGITFHVYEALGRCAQIAADPYDGTRDVPTMLKYLRDFERENGIDRGKSPPVMGVKLLAKTEGQLKLPSHRLPANICPFCRGTGFIAPNGKEGIHTFCNGTGLRPPT